jgi:lipopolysaccharide transport system permease protein
MHAHHAHPAGPGYLIGSLRRNRELVRQLVRQEVAGRYRGSLFGLAWSLLTPLLMLAVYTYVFSVVFGARWGSDGGASKAEFAVILFAGLAVFNLFADCINRAPTLVVHNANYVKRVVFPLELLPVIALGNAMFHFLASMTVWLVAAIVLLGKVPPTALLLPLILLPMVLGTLGLSWLLSSLGVYLRDVQQTTAVLVTGLLFLSPIFYPVSAVPENVRQVIKLNPVGYVVEAARGALVFGRVPDPLEMLLALAIGLAMALAGFWWFQKTRKGFADVL